jgi:hypothetical protein
MTQTTPRAVSAPPDPSRELPHVCEECEAPLDVRQRYCVACGSRNRNAPSPAADYFSRPAGRRAPAAAVTTRRRGLGPNAPAVALALLPLAVAGGVLIGKSGGNSDQKLIDALRSSHPAASAAVGTTATAAATGSSGTKSKKHASKGTHGSGKALSKTRFGTAHQVAGTKATPQQVKHDTQLVNELNKQTGKSYLERQTNLPDVVTVGGKPGSGPQPNTGAGQP